MKFSRLTESQKGILMLMIFPIFLLLTGLTMAWLLFGSEMVGWFKLLKVQIIVDVVIFTFVGLILGYSQVRAMAGLYRYLEPDTRFVDRRALAIVYTMAIACWFLYCAIQYLGSLGTDESTKNLAKIAQFSTLAGLGFSVMFVIVFIFESVAYIRSRSDS